MRRIAWPDAPLYASFVECEDCFIFVFLFVHVHAHARAGELALPQIANANESIRKNYKTFALYSEQHTREYIYLFSHARRILTIIRRPNGAVCTSQNLSERAFVCVCSIFGIARRNRLMGSTLQSPCVVYEENLRNV